MLASLDKEDYFIQKERFSLTDQLKQLIRQYQWKVSKQNLMVSLSCPPLFINGDPTLLYSVWENLFTNAIKYNEPNGTIDIIVKETETTIIVTFTDTGIGLSKAEQQRIFDRFYRVDETRTSQIEGTGLGLSIVQKIIDIHQGTIDVRNAPNRGTSFIISLPK